MSYRLFTLMFLCACFEVEEEKEEVTDLDGDGFTVEDGDCDDNWSQQTQMLQILLVTP